MDTSLQCYVERKLKGSESCSENWELCGDVIHRNVRCLLESWNIGFGYKTFPQLKVKDISFTLQKHLEVDSESQIEWLKNRPSENEWYNPYVIYEKDVSELRELVFKQYTNFMLEAKVVAKSMGIPIIMDDEDSYSSVGYYEDHDYECKCTGDVVQSVIVDQISNMSKILELGQLLELCNIAEEYSYEYDSEKHEFKEYDLRFIFVHF